MRTGYLPFADLAGFYGGALVAAFPSLCEGFGMPVLEAMACGAPVLTTRRTSLPEVGGDAVAYTDPIRGASGWRCGPCSTHPEDEVELGASEAGQKPGIHLENVCSRTSGVLSACDGTLS